MGEGEGEGLVGMRAGEHEGHIGSRAGGSDVSLGPWLPGGRHPHVPRPCPPTGASAAQPSI